MKSIPIQPRSDRAARLPNSSAEVLAISKHFESHNPKILRHEKATRSAVLDALQKAQVAHFSCHGMADWSNPEKSGPYYGQ